MVRNTRGEIFHGLLILGSVTAGITGFTVLCTAAGTKLPIGIRNSYVAFSGGIIFIITCALLWGISRKGGKDFQRGSIPISAITAAATVMALSMVYQMAAYINLPVDLLSFSESPFITDIIKMRLGLPIYTPPQDNNSYPYTPGTQVLTYLISKALGYGNSIPFYRAVQFSYVILTVIMATAVCDLLARRLLSVHEYRHRPLWIAVWLPFLFLVTTDPSINHYVHSLHNDGLAMLVSVTAFWLIVKHSITPKTWLLAGMAILPSVGFLVKQNQLIWAGIFLIYLLVSNDVSRRQVMSYIFFTATIVMTTIGICYLLWGDPFIYWIFKALGHKQVTLLRSVQHLFQAGIYALMGLFGAWVFVFKNRSRISTVLWICWLLTFGIEVYTSGLGWVANHLGPGILIGACWFSVAMVRVWPKPGDDDPAWLYRIREVVAVFSMILLLGAQGFAREPRNPVPDDFLRYVSDIENEFRGLDTDKVLIDYGSWVYLRDNVLMKDRSAPVALHVGKNQPHISHIMLVDTIKRIEEKTYDKIMVMQVEPGDTLNTWYDFQNRGSGVKAAILNNYHEIRRIRGVYGINEKVWLKGIVADVVVFVPNSDNDHISASTGSASGSGIYRD